MNWAHCVLAAERRKNIAPGASPGYTVTLDLSPIRGERVAWTQEIFRPSGAGTRCDSIHGLAPGATFCRRSAAGTLTPLRGWNARLQFIHTCNESDAVSLLDPVGGYFHL